MNNDLISREALKKYKFTTQVANGVELEDVEVVPVACIDNAPTVKFSLMPADETKEDAYKRGYERGKIAGILKANTRPQGEWIFVSRNCWKCPYCQELTNEGKNFCSNCGADMRKGGAK